MQSYVISSTVNYSEIRQNFSKSVGYALHDSRQTKKPLLIYYPLLIRPLIGHNSHREAFKLLHLDTRSDQHAFQRAQLMKPRQIENLPNFNKGIRGHRCRKPKLQSRSQTFWAGAGAKLCMQLQLRLQLRVLLCIVICL